MHTSPIRVAIALDYFDPARGGLESWVAEFARWLSARNHEVFIVATGGTADAALRLCTAAAPPLPLPRARILTRLAVSLGADVIHDTGVLLEADVFHPQTGSRIYNLRREIAARPMGERLRLAFSPGLMRWRLHLALLERKQLKSANIILAVSHLVASDLGRITPLAAEKLEIIPNGVDTARFNNDFNKDTRAEIRRKLGIGNEVLFVISAHNFLLKGVGTVIDALAWLTEEDRIGIKVCVAGDGDIPRYKKYAAERGVSRQIDFLGHVDDMAELYLAADVSLLPTFHDSCSLSTLEAMSACVPVITTAFNGAADFIDHDNDGIILPVAGNRRLLAAAMKRMLSAEVRNRFSTALKGKAERLAQENNCLRIEHIYRKILADRQR